VVFINFFLGGFSGCSGVRFASVAPKLRYTPPIGATRPLPSLPRQSYLKDNSKNFTIHNKPVGSQNLYFEKQ
jgi:hypothetical protein